MHAEQITTALPEALAQLPAQLIQEAGEGLHKALPLTATAMADIMTQMQERRTAVLWGLDIILLQTMIRGGNALQDITEARQQIQ